MARSPWRLNFVLYRLIILVPRNGTFFLSVFGRKNFEVTPRFLENFWNPVVEYLLSKHLYRATEWNHAEYLSRYLTDGRASNRILQYEAEVPAARPQYLIQVYPGSICSVFRAEALLRSVCSYRSDNVILIFSLPFRARMLVNALFLTSSF